MTANERRPKGYQPRVAEINALEQTLEALPDETLRGCTGALKKQVAGRGNPGRSSSGGLAAQPLDKDDVE
jgi:preprotein translocase subunit SecA